MSRARSHSSRSVLGGFFLLLVLAISGFALLYFRWVAFERLAARHVPVDAAFAARLDLRQVVLFAPVREHLVPLFLGSRHEVAAQKAALERIERETGVNLGMDLGEVVVVGRGDSMGVAFGGRLPETGVVEGLARMLEEEGRRGCRVDAGRLSCTHPAVFVAQADDGVVVAATDASLLDAMLPISDAFERLGIEREGPGSFGLAMPALDQLRGSLLARWSLFEELARVERIQGRLRLGDEVLVRLEAVPKPGSSFAHWPPELERLRSVVSALGVLAPGRDLVGERAVLQRLRFGATDAGHATAEATWTRAELDHAARSLATVLGPWLDRGR